MVRTHTESLPYFQHSDSTKILEKSFEKRAINLGIV